MKLIGELCDFIEDELDGIVEYGNMAAHYKAENKELADMFFNMANGEATHLKNIHAWVVKFVDKTRKESMQPVPQGMLDVWSWKHMKLVKKFNQAEIVLQNYSKL